MNSNRLNIVAPDRNEHSEELFAMLSEVWNGIDGNCRDGRINHSHYDWETSRIGLIDNKIVTHFGIYTITMRIGTARVRIAGVNLVATNPDFRKRGLMAQTTWAALDAMRAQAYDASILCNAIEGFYPRFGYVFAWPEPDYIVQTKDLPAQPPHVELHAFPPGHRDDLAAIYNRENATVTGTAVRPTFLRTKMPRDPGQGYFWTDTQGHAAGYIIYGIARDGRTLWCEDSAGDPEERLRILGMLARQAKCEHVRFGRLPYKSALCKRLRRLNCRVEAVYSKTGGWMIRIVNLQSLFEKLAPELSRRLQTSHLAEWRGNLRISAGDYHVMLAVDRSHIRILPSGESAHAMEGGAEIAQLIIGTESPDEIVEAADITRTGDASQLVEVLFPKQYPQMSNADL